MQQDRLNISLYVENNRISLCKPSKTLFDALNMIKNMNDVIRVRNINFKLVFKFWSRQSCDVVFESQTFFTLHNDVTYLFLVLRTKSDPCLSAGSDKIFFKRRKALASSGFSLFPLIADFCWTSPCIDDKLSLKKQAIVR